MPDIVSKKTNELIDPQAQLLVDFLSKMGLPSDFIIADLAQRQAIGDNLQRIVESLPSDVRTDARYLSKFVIGAGFGLFDYSLNAIWNEVVLNLRRKVVVYGLEIFFDAAVGGSRNREYYQTEDDLAAIKDSVLLDSCRKLELISDTTYKKLRHILDMRNDVGISHPTTYSINAYELLGWLQTCVTEVLNDNPTEAALQIQSFVANLKTNTTLLNQNSATAVTSGLAQLPSHLCGNLLRTIFGIFVSDDTDPIVRKNISLIAPTLWSLCKDEAKYKLGISLEGYNVNLHKSKYELGGQFFDIVSGNSFRTFSERVVTVDELVTTLQDKHDGWDNFQHEGPVAAHLYSYVPDQASIIDNLAARLFKTVLACRIGRGVSYLNGVSPGGRPYYDAILSLAGDQYAAHVLSAFTSFEIRAKLSKQVCRTQAIEALKIVKKGVVNQRIAECIDYIADNLESNPSVTTSNEFKKLSAGILDWR